MPAVHPAPISVQLYSLREAAAADFAAVLRRLGDTGFRGVELAGFNGMSTADFNSVMREAGFVVSSAHIGDASPEALQRSLDDLQAVGCSTAVLSHLRPERFESADAVAASAELINDAAQIAAARGMRFGYHNHWWEFETRIGDGTAWSQLWSLLEPGVIAELDVYWATFAGADPVRVATDLGSRLRLVHVKDGPADDSASPMVAVGAGTLDYGTILAATPHAEWHVVELDRCATDMADAIDDSYRFLVGSGLSLGRR